MSKTKDLNKKITVTGMIIALAVIVNLTRMDILLGGSPVLRISFGGPLLRFIAIAIGPLFGGIAAGITDILSYMLRPEGGPFLPELTLTSILDVLMSGLIWMWLKKVNTKMLPMICAGIFIVCTGLGLVNILALNYMPDSAFAAFLLNVKEIEFMSYAMTISGVVGLLSFIVTTVLWKSKNPVLYSRAIKLIVSVAIPTVLFTTVNTFIFRIYGFIPKDGAIIYFLIPRWIRDIFMILFATYIQLFLIELYGKVGKFEKAETNL